MSKQVTAAFNPAAAVANAPLPVSVVNVAVPPGITALLSGVATGAAGEATVGVMVAPANWPVVSCTVYFTGEAVPVNEDNGSNVTVPFAFTVYVPWPATVNDVRLQLAFAVDVDEHKRTVLATNVAGDVTVSFVRTEIA